MRKSPPFARSHKFLRAGSCSPPPMSTNPARGTAVLSAAFPARKYFHFADTDGASGNITSESSTLEKSTKAALVFVGILAQRAYQILQACSRTMASPFLQPNALANSVMFESGPFPRKRPKGCGLVLAIKRSYSGRLFVPQTCTQPRKKRCSGVKPSLSGGRGLPSSDFSYAA